jgi:CO/xanthine dehydrogenase FAD-binding subunit
MIAFNYVEPANLAEALAALARYGDEARPIAGGTG